MCPHPMSPSRVPILCLHPVSPHRVPSPCPAGEALWDPQVLQGWEMLWRFPAPSGDASTACHQTSRLGGLGSVCHQSKAKPSPCHPKFHPGGTPLCCGRVPSHRDAPGGVAASPATPCSVPPRPLSPSAPPARRRSCPRPPSPHPRCSGTCPPRPPSARRPRRPHP